MESDLQARNERGASPEVTAPRDGGPEMEAPSAMLWEADELLRHSRGLGKPHASLISVGNGTEEGAMHLSSNRSTSTSESVLDSTESFGASREISASDTLADHLLQTQVPQEVSGDSPDLVTTSPEQEQNEDLAPEQKTVEDASGSSLDQGNAQEEHLPYRDYPIDQDEHPLEATLPLIDHGGPESNNEVVSNPLHDDILDVEDRDLIKDDGDLGTPSNSGVDLEETSPRELNIFGTEPPVLEEEDVPSVESNIAPPAEPPVSSLSGDPSEQEPPPPPSGENAEEDSKSMTLIEHLEELRQRMTISAISIIVGAIIGWFLAPHLVKYLEEAATADGARFFSPSVLGPFALQLKLAFFCGIVLASPMILYQIWAFVAPGLTRRERRYALPFSLIGSILFVIGAVTGVLIVPLAIRFLTSFFPVLNLENLLDINSYIMFVAVISLIFGITFELPIFMTGFSLLGFVSSRFFIQRFKVALFIIYGVSMLITPGADLVSPLVLGTFLVILYWLGVLLIRLIGR
ncbi:MAG: twin-arginine translocase subunit TatC [Chloroflexi bacterium]|nr:twin-arginine translocase subunit TatC [Chloroflexota bacterium]